MEATEHHTDGNAIAGLLQEIFVAEFTTMERTCQSCGDRNAAGAHRAYRSAGIVHTLTRERPPPGWRGHARRIDAPMLAEAGFPPAAAPKVFVCGPTGFVEHVANLLVQLGHDPHAIKTERFGPTGG